MAQDKFHFWASDSTFTILDGLYSIVGKEPEIKLCMIDIAGEQVITRYSSSLNVEQLDEDIDAYPEDEKDESFWFNGKEYFPNRDVVYLGIGVKC